MRLGEIIESRTKGPILRCKRSIIHCQSLDLHGIMNISPHIFRIDGPLSTPSKVFKFDIEVKGQMEVKGHVGNLGELPHDIVIKLKQNFTECAISLRCMYILYTLYH